MPKHKTRVVQGMKLVRSKWGWEGTHPCGLEVYFDLMTERKNKRSIKRWRWVYTFSRASGFKTLKAAIEHWKFVFNIHTPRRWNRFKPVFKTGKSHA